MSPLPDTERYRNLFEQAFEAQLILDREGNIVAANQAACRLLRCGDVHALAGRHISELDEQATADDVRRVHGDPARHLPARFETRMRRPDGSRFPAEVHTRAVHHDDDIEVFTSLRDITGQRISDATLHDLEDQLETVVANTPLILFALDLEARITLSEGAGLDALGLDNNELVGVNALEHWGEHPELPSAIRRALAGEAFAGEIHLEGRHLNVTWTPLAGEDGVIRGATGVAYDLTDLRSTEQHLRSERDRLSTTLRALTDGVITTDAEGRIRYLNPAAEELLGASEATLLGDDADRTLALMEPDKDRPGAPVMRCLRWAQTLEYPEGRLLGHGGSRHVRTTVSPLSDDTGGPAGAVVVLQDITALTHMNMRLNHQATHDDLTELLNRRAFEQQVEATLNTPGRAGTPHVLCYMDLDQFKIVNDTCGHLAGDALLRHLASLLPRHIRESDTLARLGGDEFGLLLNHCPVDRAQQIARDIIATVRDLRFEWEGRRFDIGISIGLVPIHGGAKDLNVLLSQADSACYAAKESGRNMAYVWRDSDDRLRQRHGEMEWVGRIRDALEQGRFVPFAQPIQSLHHEKHEHHLDHLEVLVRLRDEDDQIIAPGAFIPAAERYHLMPEIDRFVIEAVLGELAAHPNDTIPVAINLSGQSLAQPDMLDFIGDRLSQHGIAPRRVTFEITETAAISNHDQAVSLIRALRYLGCHFSLDDFGSGLSSFGYLKKLSVDFLKIDGSFVRGIAHDPVDAAMVTAIHRVGRVLGLGTIAEGVEDAAGMERLRDIGLDFVQGYHIAHPRPLRDCLQELRSPAT